MKIFCYQMNPTVGDISKNVDKIVHSIKKAKMEKADVFITPELAICGYPPEDLLFFEDFISEMEKGLNRILEESSNILIVVGLARRTKKEKGKKLYNSAAVLYNKKILGFKDKTLLPGYDVFNETRYFEEGEDQKVFKYKDKKIGIFICEDVWQHSNVLERKYKRDPVEEMKKLKPDIVLTLSSSPYFFQRQKIRNEIYKKVAKSLETPFILCSQVGANDQLVFDGNSVFFDEKGKIKQIAKSFAEDEVVFDLLEKFSFASFEDDDVKDLYNALVLGVKDYFSKQNFSKACIGISGGIDSAITSCIAVDALGSQNVVGIRMPSRFTSETSLEDAEKLSRNLRIKLLDIPIDSIFQNFLDLFSPFFYGKPFDTAEENIQARIRGLVLMGISNKLGYIVLSTGNKSEMAFGYTTLYGDMCGGLGVLNDVNKTLVYELANFINKEVELIPQNILNKLPSAELKENQTDTETLPDYSIADLVLAEYVENHKTKDEIVKKHKLKKDLVEYIIERIHLAEYKRRQGPISIKVSKKAFSKGRIFPIVQGWI